MSSSSTRKRSEEPATIATHADSDTPNKKAKPCTTNSDDVKKNPHEDYFDKRKAWYNDHKEFMGAMVIKGIPRDADDDSDDEEDEDTSKFTAEQMNSLRCIMINKNREEQLDKMRTLILGEQANSSMMCFNTSFSYTVVDSWNHVKSRVLMRKSPAQKLDILLAFTHTIKEYDVWMHDNEGGMNDMVKGLAAAWKKLLKQNSDDKLGWDTQYTKPGIMELLKQFQSAIDNMDSCYEMDTFKYT